MDVVVVAIVPSLIFAVICRFDSEFQRHLRCLL